MPGLLILATWSGAFADAPAIQSGAAKVERLGPIYSDGAGSMVTSRAGDWRLSNDKISLIFAAIEGDPTPSSQPLAGYRENLRLDDRVPGAIIDLAAGGESLDFLASFTQGIGLELDDLVVEYDMSEPVQRGDEVGLRFEGSPFDNAFIRLETTYWLAEGRNRLRVETRFLGWPEDEPLPPVCDVGSWGAAGMLVEGGGVLRDPEPQQRIADFYLARGGNLCAGVAPLSGKVEGRFNPYPPLSRVLLDSLTADELASHDAITTSCQFLIPTINDLPEASGEGPVFARDLYVFSGAPNRLVDRILADRGVETGVIEGRVLLGGDGSKPIAGMDIEFLRIYRHPEQRMTILEQKAYTMARSDDQGRYRITVPEDFYIPRLLSESGSGRLGSAAAAKAGKVKERVLNLGQRSGVHVKVIDAETSRPLTARVRFEAIPPTYPAYFGRPESAGGHFENAYVGPEGRTLHLQPGKWVVHAMRGIRYEPGDLDVATTQGQIIEVVIPVKQVNPTPGWQGMEIGARTDATPGCIVKAEDIVLMASAEGLDWIVSGDFEHVTDFGPIIRELGLEGELGHSRGFRTILPAYPEWGQFLIYPLAEDAPDPAEVRAEWAELTEASEFIAALRRLYPGALIQSDLIYTEQGEGYFGIEGKNPYELSFEPNPVIDTDIDVVNLFPARQRWSIKERFGFWNNHRMSGREYIGVTGPTGRTVLGSEPGYPRLLVYTGKLDPAEVTEEELFVAFQANRTQLTSGPFIDYSVGDFMAGDMIARDPSLPVSVRITAPSWADVKVVKFEKEGMVQKGKTFHSDPSGGQRFPVPTSEDVNEYYVLDLKELRTHKKKDTLLGVAAMGEGNLRSTLPHGRNMGDTPPFAVTAPIIIDTNGNGVFDPIKLYRDKGK